MHRFHLSLEITPDDVRMFANIFPRRRRAGVLVNQAELRQVRQDIHASATKKIANAQFFALII